jgi:hypothetical protein
MMAAAAAGVMAAGADAGAQTRFRPPAEARGFLSANGIFQPTANGFSERFEFREFVETGTVETTFQADPGVGLDGMAGIRVWRGFGLGAGVTTYAAPAGTGGTVTARIPHPFHFNQHREVTGNAGLRRKETAIHGNVLYFVPVRRSLLAVVGAGPTFYQADQSFVSQGPAAGQHGVRYDHEYPYDSATLRRVDLDNESASGLGFNVSLDLTWRISRAFGAGALIRYTQATLAFTPGSREVDVTVGGVQAGLGVRVIF